MATTVDLGLCAVDQKLFHGLPCVARAHRTIKKIASVLSFLPSWDKRGG